ncbi:MAG: CHAT domain-containing protein [Thermoanaerobaculia bacterium]
MTSGSHPPAGTLAAFAEGRLDGQERRDVVEHLAGCRGCYELFEATARFVEERDATGGETGTVVQLRKESGVSLRWVAAIAAMLLLIAAAALVLRTRVASPFDTLVASANDLPNRVTTGRLDADFAYRPPPVVTRGATDEQSRNPKWLKLEGSAGDVLEENSASARERAVAMLLTGDPQRAIDLLESEVRKHPDDASAWNDLSAARLAAGEKLRDPSLAVKALAAADQALRIEPNMAPAVFNRALALEEMGLLVQAREAWQHFLELDSSSGWAAEAEAHVRKLSFQSESKRWKESIPELESAAVGGNSKQVSRIVAEFPEEARRWGEAVYLGAWADARQKGDATGAARQLTIARELGEALHEVNGESMLRDAVAAIDSSRGDALDALTRGEFLYREGRILHSRNQATAAEKMLRDSESLLRRGGSPMALVARYYVGSTLYAQTRIRECADLLDQLAAEPLESKGYDALAAQIAWERGLSHWVMGEADDALEILTAGRDLASRQSENDLRASFDVFLADYHEHLAEPALAWTYRREALESLARQGNVFRSNVCLDALSRTLAERDDWAGVTSVASLLVEQGDAENPLPNHHALLWRAMAYLERGDAASARADLAQLDRWIAMEKDQAIHEGLVSDRERLEALIDGESDPLRGAEEISRTIDYASSRDLDVAVPQLLLERGLLERKGGAFEKAQSDLDQGLRLAEEERGKVSDLTNRASLDTTWDGLFDAAIDLAVERREDDRAFSLAERRLSRDFIDASKGDAIAATPASLHDLETALSADAALLELSSLPDSVAVTLVRRGSSITWRRPVGRQDLSSRAGALLSEEPNRSREAAESLFSELIAPATQSLAGVRSLAIVADAHFRKIPFAALIDPADGKLLVEKFQLIEPPCASIALEASQKIKRKVRHDGIALLVDPQSRDPRYAALSGAEAEVDRLAALYPNAVTLRGDDATRERVLAMLPTAALVHFAGHGEADPAHPRRSSLLLSGPHGAATRLEAAEIASLRLPATALVVLGACDSGKSLGRNGIDSVGAAFLAAGATRVVASRWKIEDAGAAELLSRFHRRLTRGETPIAALRGVQIDAARASDGSLRPLREWAALYLMGGSEELLN